MRKVFEFEETVKYIHSIEIDIADSREEEYEKFADVIAEDLENKLHININKYDIIDSFNRKFGKYFVNFDEDGSPLVSYKAL